MTPQEAVNILRREGWEIESMAYSLKRVRRKENKEIEYLTVRELIDLALYINKGEEK